MPARDVQQHSSTPLKEHLPPLFSVIIPTYNRTKPLRRCLETLAQGYPDGRFEIIVVDDGSNPPVDPGEGGWPVQLVVLRQTNQGPSAARNSGARRARGTYLIFLDDDCQVLSGWFEAIERAVGAAAPRTMFGGKIVNSDENNLCSEVSEVFIRIILERHRPRPGGLYFFRSTNMIVPRDEFLRMGGFDERFRASEDREFCDRWQAGAGSFQYVPDAVAIHRSELTVRAFARQHFAYGRGAWHFHQARFSRKSSRIGFDMLKYYAQVIREVVRPRRGVVAVRIGLLALWQAMNVCGFVCALLDDVRGSRVRTRPI